MTAAKKDPGLSPEEQLKSGKVHILIVEDEEGLRYMLQTKLYQEGYNVSVAATGKHALQKLRSGQQFDLIICDLKMPGLSGLDVYKEYKSSGGNTPYVILTGFPDKAKIVEAKQLGVKDVILKPIKPTDLLARVNEYIGK